jgi:hypothetical protein
LEYRRRSDHAPMGSETGIRRDGAVFFPLAHLEKGNRTSISKMGDSSFVFLQSQRPFSVIAGMGSGCLSNKTEIG